MAEYVELIDKYRIVQSEDTDYNPPSYDWVDNTGQIVRCMDCKHYQGVYNCQGHAPCDYWGIGGVLWNDFCSHGEKREES